MVKQYYIKLYRKYESLELKILFSIGLYKISVLNSFHIISTLLAEDNNIINVCHKSLIGRVERSRNSCGDQKASCRSLKWFLHDMSLSVYFFVQIYNKSHICSTKPTSLFPPFPPCVAAHSNLITQMLCMQYKKILFIDF